MRPAGAFIAEVLTALVEHAAVGVDLLDLDALGERAALVSYPPGDTWDGYRHSDRAREDAFAESFHFFGEANGEVLKRGTRPWHPLPRPGETPTLPIYPARRR